MEFKPGDLFTVMIDSRPYETYIDENSTQRFREDPTHPLWDRWCGDKASNNRGRFGRGTEDLNALCVAYSRGEFDQHTYMEFNISIGYSVSGFSELHNFWDLDLMNPLWGDPELIVLD